MLYIVSTPIGNFKDITLRAIEVLKLCPIIITESPSDSLRLLRHLELVKKKVIKYNDNNKKVALKGILELLRAYDCAYISSAGTPGISDPGQDLVESARNSGIGTFVIPGPSALVSAIAMSGFRTREFSFISFPPKKSGQFINLLKKYQERGVLLSFFESTHRILKTLELLSENFPKANIFVAKEMTKIFEKYFKGNSVEVLEKFKSDPKNVKGEFVLIIDFSS